MKSVMLSIHPKWCELIASGKKTIEVRKTKPKIDVPFKAFIYQSKSKSMPFFCKQLRKAGCEYTAELLEHSFGKVIGEFVCDYISPVPCYDVVDVVDVEMSCLSPNEIREYGKGKMQIYGWHISDLKIYDKPKEISEFVKAGALSYDDWLYGIYNGKGGARSSYESYKNVFKLTRPPQSWCYVEELE